MRFGRDRERLRHNRRRNFVVNRALENRSNQPRSGSSAVKWEYDPSRAAATGCCDTVSAGTAGSTQGPSAAQIRGQQAMEQMFTRFAPHGEPPRTISARVQAALHGLADSHVLVVDPFPHGDTLPVPLLGRWAHIVKIEVEDHDAGDLRHRAAPGWCPCSPGRG